MPEITQLVRPASSPAPVSSLRRSDKLVVLGDGPYGGVDYARFNDQPVWTYWNIIRRHRWLIFGLFILAQLLTAIAIFLAVPYYSATSTILVERQGPQVLDANKSDEPAEGDPDSFYKAQHEILESRSLAAAVIRELGLKTNPLFSPRKPPESAIAQLVSWTTSVFSAPAQVRNRKKTNLSALGVKPEIIDAYLERLTIRSLGSDMGTPLINVIFSSPDPELAAAVVNAHVQQYIRRGVEMQTQASEAVQRLLEKKLVELEQRMEKSEAALNSYRRERGIIAFALDDKDQIIVGRIADLNRALAEAETERISAQVQLQVAQNRDFDSIPAVVSSPLIQNLKSELSRVEGEYASQANQFKPEYPPLAQLRARLDELRTREQAEIKRVVAGIDSSYQQAAQKETQLNNALEEEKTRAMALKDASLQDAILARQVDTNRELYKSVLERMRLLGVAGQFSGTKVSIVDQAETPLFPSSPKKRLSFALSGFFALMLGVAISFFLEHMDFAFKNSDEVEPYLQVPHLGAIPNFAGLSGRSVSGAFLPRRKALLRLPGRKKRSASKEMIVLTESPSSAASEAYRAIRTGLLLSRSERPPKTILISSAAAGEGKSVTAINCAIAFAHMTDRVLLVDADLRRARCHKILGVDNRIGLSHILTGQLEAEDVILPTNVNGLSLLSAGLMPPNPSELLGSKKMCDLLASLGSKYQQIIIDSPPVLPVSDSVVLSTLVDGVLLVAGPRTPKTAIRDASSRLLNVGAKVLGVVLNGVDLKYVRRHAALYTEYYQQDSEAERAPLA